MLRRLAWSSVPSPSFSAARLNQITTPSRSNNERNHISGMLLFTGAHFLSILEGEERILDELWLRLVRDQRHCDLFRIGDELCRDRLYPEWMMAYEVDPVVDAQIDQLRAMESKADRDWAGTRVPSGTGRSPQAQSTPMWVRIIQPIMAHADSM